MRILTVLAMAAMATSALAQTTLSTLTGGTNQGNVGGGVYFDLQVNTTITITSLNFQVGANTVAGTNAFVDLYLGPSTYLNNVTNPGLWTKVGSTAPATVTGGVVQMVTAAVVPVPQIASVTLAPGNYGFALKSNNHNHGYTNGATCTSTTTPGACANSTFSTPELVIRAGAAQNAFLSGAPFSPRIFNGAITYTVGRTPITFAQREPYGAGCYNNFRSFYQFYPSSAALTTSNTSMLLTFDGINNRYVVSGGTTAVVPPTTATLGHTANNDIVVTLNPPVPILFPSIGGPAVSGTTVEMSANGYVNLLGSNPAAAGNPTVAAFLTGTPRIGNWHDFDPAAGGTTHYEFDAVNGAHLFTWNNVPDAAIAATSNTFQLAFFANGNVEFRWGTMSVAGGGGWPTLIGFTPGGNAADPGSRDLSTSLPFATAGVDQPPLALAGDVNPVLGTTVNLTTTNVTGSSLGICFVCLNNLPFSPTGFDLASIGAPGCVANVDINVGAGYLISNLGPGFPSTTIPFPIPAGPLSILGLSFYSQSVWLDATQNAGGLLSSNALRLKIGSF